MNGKAESAKSRLHIAGRRLACLSAFEHR